MELVAGMRIDICRFHRSSDPMQFSQIMEEPFLGPGRPPNTKIYMHPLPPRPLVPLIETMKAAFSCRITGVWPEFFTTLHWFDSNVYWKTSPSILGSLLSTLTTFATAKLFLLLLLLFYCCFCRHCFHSRYYGDCYYFWWDS